MAKIKKKHLQRIGLEQGNALKLALELMEQEPYKAKGRQAKLQLIQAIRLRPEAYVKDQILRPLALEFQLQGGQRDTEYVELKAEGLPYQVYGAEHIEKGALQQIEVAARLPIARKLALMPDAHQGYGLPIGGVLATENSVIPYAVGVDIGCRMSLSVYDVAGSFLDGKHKKLEQILLSHTYFGQGKGPKTPQDHEILTHDTFQELALARTLKDKAWRQLGSSGSGNHFVEFGWVSFGASAPEGLAHRGPLLALLSHSGSRGLGASIADHYTKLAMKKICLPSGAKHLAWLDLDSDVGQEYWQGMSLAGEYAKACHEVIHRSISKALGEKAILTVENHHNFAWKERMSDGTELIVHRKGATPAAEGQLGIIPGSMTAPGFIVRGRGNSSALYSASHGAGRLLSRRKALQTLTKHQINKELRQHKVSLIGGGVDEAPMAYKDIHTVMKSQRALIEVIGEFKPRIVRMDE